MKKLSIIIPVYNSALYLPRCLESVLAQENAVQLQIIIINDGSTDNSSQVIDEYVKRFPGLFEVHTTANLGVSNARNLGLDAVTTDYFTFIDADDWVAPNLYKEALATIEAGNYDFVSFDYIEQWGNEVKRCSATTKLHRSKYYLGSLVWNKVYRTSFWQQHQIKFSTGIRYEDVEFTTLIYANSNNFGFVNNKKAYYNYERTNSSSFMSQARDLSSLITVFESLIRLSKQNYDPELLRFLATTFFFHLVLFSGDHRFGFRLYRKYRWLFDRNHIDSRASRFILSLQLFHCEFLLPLILMLLQYLKVNPNKL
jgi:hypothetical protein